MSAIGSGRCSYFSAGRCFTLGCAKRYIGRWSAGSGCRLGNHGLNTQRPFRETRAATSGAPAPRWGNTSLTLVEVAINSWLPTQGNPDKDLYGLSGDTVVTGGYTLIPRSSQTFDVQWGVLRTHSTSFHGNDFGWDGNDGCLSDYAIDLTVVGPAGLRPF